MKTKLNPILWLLVLIALDIIFAKQLLTGDIVNYLHPRMVPFFTGAFISLLILTLAQMRKVSIDELPRQNFKWGLLVYLLPILLSFTNPQILNADIIANRNQNLGVSTNTSTSSTSEFEKVKSVNSPPSIKTANDPFLLAVSELQHKLDENIGKTYTLQGFVFRKEDFADNQIVVARMWLTCCAADASVVGIMLENDSSAEYTNDSWIEVSGTVDAYEYTDPSTGRQLRIPILKNTKIKTIDALSTPYVYN